MAALSKQIKFFSIFIWPIFSLYFIIKDFRYGYAKNLLWCFCIFYGLIHIVFNDYGYYVDGMAYAEMLQESLDLTFVSFCDSLYKEGNNTVDIFMPLLTFLISRITDNYRVLFVFLSTIFGYFYSRNIWYIYDCYKGKMNIFMIILFFTIAFILPIYQINGRFWIALHIFFYGAFPYVYHANKKSLKWMLLAPFVHFSFFLPVLLLLLYEIFPKNSKVYFILLCISMLITTVNLESINGLIKFFAPDIFESKIDVYASTEYLQRRIEADTDSIHVIFYNNMIKWLFRLILFFIYIYHRVELKKDSILNNLFCFTTIITIFASVMAMVPSASRFLYLESYLVLSIVVIIISRTSYNIFLNKKLRFIISIFLLYFIFFQIRSFLSFIGFSFFFTNPFLAILYEDNKPILYLIKDII